MRTRKVLPAKVELPELLQVHLLLPGKAPGPAMQLPESCRLLTAAAGARSGYKWDQHTCKLYSIYVSCCRRCACV